MRTYPEQILTNGNMTGSLTSSPIINTGSYWGGSIGCVVTAGASASGTLALQGSADGVNFTTMKSGTTPITLTVAGNGTYLFDVTATGVQNMQITYTPVSGTGTLNINIWMKGY